MAVYDTIIGVLIFKVIKSPMFMLLGVVGCLLADLLEELSLVYGMCCKASLSFGTVFSSFCVLNRHR